MAMDAVEVLCLIMDRIIELARTIPGDDVKDRIEELLYLNRKIHDSFDERKNSDFGKTIE